MNDLTRAGAALAGFWLGGAALTWWALRQALRDETAGRRPLYVALWPVSWLLVARARHHILVRRRDKEA